MPFKLGKRPPKQDARTLRLRRYLRPELPAPPPVIDHASIVPKWEMYANDKFGDCGPAGCAHQTVSWSHYAGRPLIPTEKQVIDAYFEITGGQDVGVYMLDLMKYWRNKGIGGDQIEAFVQIDDDRLVEAKLAIQLFGSLGVGLALPDKHTFGPWTDVTGAPNPFNGHYVCAVAYDDSLQLFRVVTWGELWDMSYAWYEKYCDEAFVALNDLSINLQTMTSPEGFDFKKLENDLGHLGDPVDGGEPPVEPPPDPGSGCLGKAMGLSGLAALVGYLFSC